MVVSKLDPEVFAHLEWLGFVRPTGLVVSAPALVRAGAILDRRDAEGQRLLRACIEERAFDHNEGSLPYFPDFRRFAESVLGWSFSSKAYAGTTECPIPAELELPLPDYGETLRPDFAVRELEPKDGASPWQLLVRVLEPGEQFDRVVRGHGHFEASAHSHMERLLRQTGVPAGLLFNGRALRLVSAPRGESSGWLDFSVGDMIQTAGRPISTALRLLLGQPRLLALPRAQRLAALLEDSRKFQNEVSERLAEQVLHALYEFLRGFQAAHDASKGELLRGVLVDDPDDVYRALLTVILRLVFLLYAEERDILPEDETFLRYYSLAGLYERLREDAALFPDTMDQRYGAWAQLLVLFRMIHDGAESGAMRLPTRHGSLFDPDRFIFLEGRTSNGNSPNNERMEAPLVPDGTIYRAVEKLLVLDGERISYRALDVEQIGSVYETMMGFRLETATGRSLAIKAEKKQGAPTAVDLEALLAEPVTRREKWLQDHADRKVAAAITKAVAAAMTVEDLHSALLPVVDFAATPDLVARGSMVLQPSDERRRSGSHYTPRALTEPIVRTTLDPILARLRGTAGTPPRPSQILDLKVCDPAMGSGAFLVEVCRYLGDSLVEAWHAHGELPAIPLDEDELIFARSLVAQRCLYGVDKNPVAVDLAKVSLWLVTLAKDHALTFVDHALRHGDSLVGLSRRHIEGFHWDPDAAGFRAGFETMRVRDHLAKSIELRRRIREADESVPDWKRRELWRESQVELDNIRLFGDLVLAAFFEGGKPNERERKRSEYANAVVSGVAERYRAWLEERRRSEYQPFVPFHWEIEFPEVFEPKARGFSAVVGNPPFLGGKLIAPVLGDSYNAFLKVVFEESKGAADLCAYFFRRMFTFLQEAGTLGLLATNTVAQADTREVGLDWIARNGGDIYCAVSRVVWPGMANVHVSVVHISKGPLASHELNGNSVAGITTHLTVGRTTVIAKPRRLAGNFPLASGGTGLLGIGFVIDTMTYQAWLERDECYRDILVPYVNGREVNTMYDDIPARYVINFGDRSEREAEAFPLALERVRVLVKPERHKLTRQIHERCYWKHWDKRTELYASLAGLRRVLVCSFVSKHLPFTFLPPGWIYSKELVVIPTDDAWAFAVLQSSTHAFWARQQSGTLKSDLSYSIGDALRTLPLPTESPSMMRKTGEAFFQGRANAMQRRREGLTAVYNRFHDPDERDAEIANLRELFSAMDRAVLDAYGWTDIQTNCEFLLDYEIDEERWGDKKKPWRYRWPDSVRDEVLARLLELNARHADEEVRSGTAVVKKGGNKAVTPGSKSNVLSAADLFS